MTFAEVSATGKHSVSSTFKGLQNESGINSASTHYPDHPYIWRILVAGYAGGIGCCIAAPVAKEAQDARIETLLGHGYLLNS